MKNSYITPNSQVLLCELLNYKIKKIKEIVKDMKYTVDGVGRSEDEVYIFEDKYILKISKDKKV